MVPDLHPSTPARAPHSSQARTPPTLPREGHSRPDTVDDTTLAEVMGSDIEIRGQRTRATSLGLPYRRFHVEALRQFFVDIHSDVCAYTLEVSERFSTGCDSRVELVCGSADNGCACAFHGKKLRAGTINSALARHMAWVAAIFVF